MGTKYNSVFSKQQQFSILQGMRSPDPFSSQSSATDQIPIDQRLSNADLIRRVAILENTVEKLNNLFTVSNVTINTLGDKNWELKQPLNVAVEQRGIEDFVACLYDVDMYGYGETIPDALEDLKETIINQFEFLLQQNHKTALGNLPKNQFEFLNSILVGINV